MERMDTLLDETDDQGRMPRYGKVAVAAIVGADFPGAERCRLDDPRRSCL